jgi:hypothetical protein
MNNEQYNSWISENTWKIMYMKIDVRRKGKTEIIGKLEKEVQKNLKLDRKTRIHKVALEID